MAKTRKWHADGAFMLQCVLLGKAQQAYSSLSLEDRSSYSNTRFPKCGAGTPGGARVASRGCARGNM